jgi:alpha-ketoglutarate-dependent taurine dioxygenase
LGYEPNPSDYSILKLVRLPETGGGMFPGFNFQGLFLGEAWLTWCGVDTLYASACEIYDKISPTYRKFLEGLTASMAQPRYHKTAADKGFEVYSEPRGAPANVGTALSTTHPVVRTNPVTGWKSLYGVGMHWVRYDGLSGDESRRLHDWLLQMIVENHDCQLRFRWENECDVGEFDFVCC